ncbi:MAG TPA: arginase family protein [Chthoniobacterales bacterium]|nr:arginase family protein [Chthoniobacterales bacterium]
MSLIELPYDSGRFNLRMGHGPRGLLDAGLVQNLRGEGFEVEVVSIALSQKFHTEASALVELQRAAGAAIRASRARGARPILLSGNCGPAALSAIAALGAATTGVIWFDAHADFNTPDTSASGFLDGMGLAILTGACWHKLAAQFDSFEPVPEEHVLQIGVRDVDDDEALRLAQSRIIRLGPNQLASFSGALRELVSRTAGLYVHLDVDVLDLSLGCANSYACAGGLMLEELERLLQTIAASGSIRAASITSYDPEADADGRIGRAIPRLIEILAG